MLVFEHLEWEWLNVQDDEGFLKWFGLLLPAVSQLGAALMSCHFWKSLSAVRHNKPLILASSAKQLSTFWSVNPEEFVLGWIVDSFPFVAAISCEIQHLEMRCIKKPHPCRTAHNCSGCAWLSAHTQTWYWRSPCSISVKQKPQRPSLVHCVTLSETMI